MILGNVERLEVKKVEFDLRSPRDLEAERGEDVHDLVLDERARMQTAQRTVSLRIGHVDALFAHAVFGIERLEHALFVVGQCGDEVARLVDIFANLRFLLRRHVLHPAKKRGQFAALAQILDLDRRNVRRRSASLDVGLCRRDQVVDLFFHITSKKMRPILSYRALSRCTT